MHCLNLKVTYECTNDCSFCFSSYLKNEKICEEGLIQAVKDGFGNGCRELVISGGEPTMFPEKVIKILACAESLGYEKYIIQTNGSGLAYDNQLLTEIREIACKKDFCISFSIHGNQMIHDELSCTPGAYDKLIKAMDNIKESECKIYSNTVINKKNINMLKSIVDIVRKYNPAIMQFSVMHVEKDHPLKAGLLETVRAVKELKDYVSLSVLKTEGIPFCLMYGMESCVGESMWPNVLDLYNKNDDYIDDFKQLDSGMRWKAELCQTCIMDGICMGIWKEHREEFVNSGIKSIM